MANDLDAIRAAVEPVVTALDLELYDVELSGSGRARVLRVLLRDPSGPADQHSGGISIDRLTEATRALDGVVDDLVSGAFSLEVSSPGLERPLRRAEHFAGALRTTISVKHRPDGAAARRDRGVLIAADDTAIELQRDSGDTVRIEYPAITAAHTVFEWGPAPRPGKGPKAPAGQRTKETSPS